MLITLISIIIIIAGIILYKEGSWEYETPSAIMIMIGAIASFVCLMVIMMAQIPKENDYEKKLYEKEVIEYRLENADNNIIGNELLYNDIVEFNNSLRTTKRYANSLWTNWFYNADIASIEYIDYKGDS